MNTKEAVRQACKSQRAALSVADCRSWTPMLTNQIVNSPEYISAKNIMAYLAMPKEANLLHSFNYRTNFIFTTILS